MQRCRLRSSGVAGRPAARDKQAIQPPPNPDPARGERQSSPPEPCRHSGCRHRTRPRSRRRSDRQPRSRSRCPDTAAKAGSSGVSSRRAASRSTLMRTRPAGRSRNRSRRSSASSIRRNSGSRSWKSISPGRREPDAAAGAVEQPHTEPGFQATDGMAQCRCGDAPNGRGAPEATMANDVEEGVEIGQIGAAGHPASLSFAHLSVKQLTTASEAEARYKPERDLPRQSLTGYDQAWFRSRPSAHTAGQDN